MILTLTSSVMTASTAGRARYWLTGALVFDCTALYMFYRLRSVLKAGQIRRSEKTLLEWRVADPFVGQIMFSSKMVLLLEMIEMTVKLGTWFFCFPLILLPTDCILLYFNSCQASAF
jgi:hypothetical protein